MEEQLGQGAALLRHRPLHLLTPALPALLIHQVQLWRSCCCMQPTLPQLPSLHIGTHSVAARSSVSFPAPPGACLQAVPSVPLQCF